MSKPRCPFAVQCGLSRIIGMEAALGVWESFYCQGHFERCERFRLHGAGEAVPDRLLPNGRLLDAPAAPAAVRARRDARPPPPSPSPLRRAG